jgi:hypothetical protein
MFRRSIFLIAAAAASVVFASALPATAADPIGPNQYFEGLVNGRTKLSSIRIACLGPVQPGQLGRPLPGQTVAVRRASYPSTNQVGFTGGAGRSVIAFFSPSASNSPSVTLTEYGVAAPIPGYLTLPCTGTGEVFFSPSPTSWTARSTSVIVTFIS